MSVSSHGKAVDNNKGNRDRDGRKRRGKGLVTVLVCAAALTAAASNWPSLALQMQKLATFLTAMIQPAAAQPEIESPVTVIVRHASPENGMVRRHFVAVIQPSFETALSFQVPGRIDRRFVETGDRVERGQVLARLSQNDFELHRDTALAEVQAAERMLSVMTEEEARTAKLQQNGIVSQARFESAQGRLQEAASRLDQAQARLRIAENAFGYTVLKAESDGIVLDEMIEPGQVVAAGQTVLRVSPVDTYEADVALPESIDLPSIGDRAVFRPWADPERTIQTHLYEISPIADPTTRTFNASFALVGPQTDGLKYGMTGQLILTQGDVDEIVLRLPSSAVYDSGNGKGPGVWRVTDANRLAFVPVEIRHLDGNQVLVEAALKPDDQIVSLGANRLSEGLLVRTRLGGE
jgi:RND family efflux transporter MFP subunit